jgi:threonine synthase
VIRCHGCRAERREKPLPIICPDCGEVLPDVVLVPRGFGDYLRREYPGLTAAFEQSADKPNYRAEEP